MPERIQRKRTKGWRMPPNTVYVGRPSRWANIYKVDDNYIDETGIHWAIRDAAKAVELFREWVTPHQCIIEECLRGKNLCCWCPLDQPCHADVLLEMANV